MSQSHDYSAEQSEAPAKGGGELSNLARLAVQLVELDAHIARETEAMKTLVERRKLLAEKTIPDVMEACGQTDIGLPNGAGRLRLISKIKASITEANRPKAHAWLRDHGFGSLVKNEIKLAFGKNQDNVAKSLFEELREKGLDPQRKEAVHPQTLMAFVRDMREEGREVPDELLGVVELREASIELA